MEVWSERFDKEPSIFESRPWAAFFSGIQAKEDAEKWENIRKMKWFIISIYEKFTIINTLHVFVPDIDKMYACDEEKSENRTRT
ncbi:hypothetical protein [Paenibacillus sp. ACRRY]|uniref:hypothetical protein n=1 Tax=Paenibacillus sp. ACRRY TaxID=2918208 RepID=UPI001EF4DEFC|nr:hypothetical protein [Paenibacillus sp. ACRRY]MCG7381166.1 hypothetical protein [Paenibacillus sp. ACRRY]